MIDDSTAPVLGMTFPPLIESGKGRRGRFDENEAAPYRFRPGGGAPGGMLTVLPHHRGRRLEPNADGSPLVDKGTLDGNPF